MPDACDCERPGGAHDEKCAYIKSVRRPEYKPDVTIPPELRRTPPTRSVLD